jgi:4-amino-4-deoxy-L-arabinose transferase-like glycosyltransferase
MSSRRWTLLLAVALLALILRLVYIVQIANAPFFDLRIGDAKAYHEWALRIAGGDWIGTDVFYQAPLYPYFLAVVYKLFGDGPTIVRFVQAVIGAGSCVLIAAAGMALFGEWGVTAGFLLAIYAPAIFLDGLLEKSALVTFLMSAVLCLLSMRPFNGRAWLTGVALGLLALTRENALLLALPIGLWFVIGDRERVDWRQGAAFVAGCALTLLPIAIRNYAIDGQLHVSTSQFGPNFYIGNNPHARGLYDPLVAGHGNAGDERADATRLAEAASGRTLSSGEVSAYWTARALDFIRARPTAWMALLGRKLALTFNAAEVADTESPDVYAEWSSLLRTLSPVSFGVVFSLGVVGLALTASDWRRLWGLYAIAIVYTLSVVIFYVFARYRFPLVPVLMLFAAGGLATWRTRRAANTSRAPLRWTLVAALVAGVIAFFPLVDTRVDRLAHYINIANTLAASPKRWDQAETFFNRAIAISPQSPAAHYGIGMLLAQQHQPREAVIHYRTAVDGWPDNVDLRLNYALALAATGDDAGAAAQVAIARTLNSRSP